MVGRIMNVMNRSNAFLFAASFALIMLIFFLGTLTGSSSEYNKKRAEQLYMEHCSKCHRKDGRGVRRVYPPLLKADYIENASTKDLLRGMIYGRSGRITVNGITYNGVMTTEIDNNLSDNDIALILTYVYQEMNNINKTVTAEEVVAARKAGKLPKHD
jgi:mono/diheme cytochrome c family protein